jgi:restriction system protein
MMIPAKNYYRIMLGSKSKHADECHKDSFIGGDWLMNMDLTGKLPDNWRTFNQQFIPVYLKNNPGKSRVAAGLACGMLHTICKGIQIGDVVLCPNGSGAYYVGEVVSDYRYVPEGILPHRRSVNWHAKEIGRNDMSPALKNSTGSAGTVSNITKYAEEIESLLAGNTSDGLIPDELVEDPIAFALEKHLEDFLVHNWGATELGKDYDIFEEEGELVGQQYPSDTGPIDILAIGKDQKELLVVELKKGRASDAVVGQIQRYMGYVMEELAEPGQTVKGVIIAMEDNLHIRRALKVAINIEFYRYQIDFKLIKV